MSELGDLEDGLVESLGRDKWELDDGNLTLSTEGGVIRIQPSALVVHVSLCRWDVPSPAKVQMESSRVMAAVHKVKESGSREAVLLITGALKSGELGVAS